jgi:hypothetical protein
LEKVCQVENLLVILLYPLSQIMFDGFQSHVDLVICLNLAIPYVEH